MIPDIQLDRHPRPLHWEEAVRNAIITRQTVANNVMQMLALLAVFFPPQSQEEQKPEVKALLEPPRNWGGNDYY